MIKKTRRVESGACFLFQSCFKVVKLFFEGFGKSVEFGVMLFNQLGFFSPLLPVYFKKLVEAVRRQIETFEVDVLRAGDVAYGRVVRWRVVLAAVDNPIQNSQIVAEAGPQEFSVFVGAEPVR